MNHRIWIAALLFGAGLCAAPCPVAAQDFLGQRWDKWDRDLKAKDSRVRRGGAFALGKIGPKAAGAVPHLVDTLRLDKDAKVQEAAAYALGEVCLSGPGATAAVLGALGDALTSHPDPAVRRSAAVALGNIGLANPQVLAALNGKAEDDNPAVRQNVAWALGKVGDDNIATLRKLLHDADTVVKMNAANAVAAHDAPRAKLAVTELLSCCNDKDGELKRAAVVALVKLVGPEDSGKAGPLVAALGDKDLEVRRNAAFALGNIGGPTGKTAVPLLREILRSGELEERKQAAAAIKNIAVDAREAIDDLRVALKDKNKELRQYVAVALGGLERAAEKAVPELAALVTDANEELDVRVAAAVALSRIGPVPAALTAAPELLRVVEDDKAPMRVRERALWALRVHRNDMLNIKGLFPAMTKLMTDAKGQDAKMLRYDCAYLLGVFQGPKAPKETLDVLHEFLKDDKIQIYAGTGGKVTGGTTEKKGGQVDLKEKRVGDGRVMAVQALTTIGKQRLLERPEVVTQLRTIAADGAAFEDLRKDVNKLLETLK